MDTPFFHMKIWYIMLFVLSIEFGACFFATTSIVFNTCVQQNMNCWNSTNKVYMGEWNTTLILEQCYVCLVLCSQYKIEHINNYKQKFQTGFGGGASGKCYRTIKSD
jgi:hypothetical protein